MTVSIEKKTTLDPKEWIILTLGLANGRIEGATVLQKIVFLGVMEDNGEGVRFEPSHYGPYSQDLDTALKQLEQEGYIRIKTEVNTTGKNIRKILELTEKGWREYKNLIEKIKENKEFIEKYKKTVEDWSKSPIGVVLYVYTYYPYYASQSIIKDRFLRKERKTTLKHLF